MNNQTDLQRARADAVSLWQPIETAPKDEAESFLIRRDDDLNAVVIIQVSNFEGNMYPDALGGCIDFDDRITDAIDWQPLPTPPMTEQLMTAEELLDKIRKDLTYSTTWDAEKLITTRDAALTAAKDKEIRRLREALQELHDKCRLYGGPKGGKMNLSKAKAALAQHKEGAA